VLTETVPALSSFDAATSDGRWSCNGTAAGASCTLSLGAVAPGASQNVVFAVRQRCRRRQRSPTRRT
jgi:hypothetical protein